MSANAGNSVTADTVSVTNRGRLEYLIELTVSGELNSLPGPTKYRFLQEAIEDKDTEIAKLLLKNAFEVQNEGSSNSSFTLPVEEDDAERLTAANMSAILRSIIMNDDREVLEMLLDNDISEFGQPLLHAAIQNNDIPIVNLLLSREININAADDKGMRPLDIAIRTNNIRIVELLLNSGADPNAADAKSTAQLCSTSTPQSPANVVTPLHRAVRKGCQEITKLLLDNNADVDIRTKNGMTPLHIAVLLGCERIAEELLSHGASINTACTFGGEDYVLLHFAIQKGHSSLVRLLLKYGASVHAQNKHGKAALEIALEKRNTMIVAYIFMSLIDADNNSNEMARLDAIDGFEIEYAKMVDHVLELARDDLKNLSNRDVLLGFLLQAAVKRQNQTIVQDHLNYGVNVNTSTALHAAAKIDENSLYEPASVAMVHLLLSNGADVNAKDKFNKTPIFYSIESNSLNITKMLLANGACLENINDLLRIAVRKTNMAIIELILEHESEIDIGSGDEHGNTVLHCIVTEKNFHVCDVAGTSKAKVAKLLIEKGADPNARNMKGMTPLHIAAREGCREVVAILLEYNADVNATDISGMTPLHLSASEGCEEICKRLLEKKVDISSRDFKGITALHMAFGKRRLQVVEMLLKSGTDIRITDVHGNTALHFNGLTKEETIVGNSSYRTIRNIPCQSFNRWITKEATHGTGKCCLDESDCSNKKIAEVLLRNGADANARNNDYLTPLHAVARKGYVEVAAVMLEYNADINATDTRGFTPLHFSVLNRRTAMSQMLLTQKADINAITKEGNSALHYASEIGNERAVDILFQHGADIDCKTINGRTSLHLAVERANVEVIMVLLKSDADINVTCHEGKRPLDCLNTSKRCSLVTKIFKHHIVKMNMANRWVSTRNIEFLYIGCPLDSFKQMCKEEIEKIKKERVSRNVSYYDILSKDINRLAIYSRNKTIVQAIESGDYQERFPIYCNMISNSLRRGARRDALLNLGVTSLNTLIGYCLPDIFSINIFTYLTNKDLEHLIEACPDLDISEVNA